ncbi:class I SAM-dependent methyltransferase [Nocardioides sp. P5_E3]
MTVSSKIKQVLRSKGGAPLAGILGGPVSVLKYLPEAYGQNSYAISMNAGADSMGVDDDLAIPPVDLWLGYGSEFGDKAVEWYISKGRRDVETMLAIVGDDAPLKPDARIIEMGCAAGRMIRHLKPLVGDAEIWGVDVAAPLVNWCKVNLAPPFHFATTTTIPHLPFPDDYFDLVYTGSVFTHIDDLAEAWLLELRRVLVPGGRAYLTIHDRHTIELLDAGYYFDPTGYFTEPDRKEEYLTRTFNAAPAYQAHRDDFGMFVVGRDYTSQVFYDIDYFKKMVTGVYEVRSVNHEAYGHQTAVLLARRP